MKRDRRYGKGFTLIELMVTLAIGVILMLVAVPSFITYKRNAELTSATNTLLTAINAARGEAMKQGVNAMVVPTNNGASWADGWVVFVDKNRSQSYTSTDTLVLSQAAPPSYIEVIGNSNAALSTPYIMFDSSGYPRSKAGSGGGTSGTGNLTMTLRRTDVSGVEQVDQTRRVIIANTGRVRSCRPLSSSDSNCAASTTSTAN